MTFGDAINLISNHSGLLTAVPVIATGLWAVLKFRDSLRDKRFKTYHELIDELVNEQRQPDRHIKLDRQVAIIYELRNYPDYYPVTSRILTGLKAGGWNQNSRAEEEIDQTLIFISQSWFRKLWRRFWKI